MRSHVHVCVIHMDCVCTRNINMEGPVHTVTVVCWGNKWLGQPMQIFIALSSSWPLAPPLVVAHFFFTSTLSHWSSLISVKALTCLPCLFLFFLLALVVLTSLGGYTMAPSAVDPVTLLWAVTGTALCSASANSFNQWMEVEYDSLMTRTKNRVLVRKQIRWVLWI